MTRDTLAVWLGCFGLFSLIGGVVFWLTEAIRRHDEDTALSA